MNTATTSYISYFYDWVGGDSEYADNADYDMEGWDWHEYNQDMVEGILEGLGYENIDDLIFMASDGTVVGIDGVIQECYDYYSQKFGFDIDDWVVFNDDNWEATLFRIALDDYECTGWGLDDWKQYGNTANWVQSYYYSSGFGFIRDYSGVLTGDGLEGKSLDEIKEHIMNKLGADGLKTIEFWVDHALER